MRRITRHNPPVLPQALEKGNRGRNWRSVREQYREEGIRKGRECTMAWTIWEEGAKQGLNMLQSRDNGPRMGKSLSTNNGGKRYVARREARKREQNTIMSEQPIREEGPRATPKKRIGSYMIGEKKLHRQEESPGDTGALGRERCDDAGGLKASKRGYFSTFINQRKRGKTSIRRVGWSPEIVQKTLKRGGKIGGGSCQLNEGGNGHHPSKQRGEGGKKERLILQLTATNTAGDSNPYEKKDPRP